MFRRNMDMNPNGGFYQENQIERLLYQLEETNRRLRYLNNRLKRIESYLGLIDENKFDSDLYFNE